MSEPILTFLYNYSETDSPYIGNGGPVGDWKEIYLPSEAAVSAPVTSGTEIETGTASGIIDTSVSGVVSYYGEVVEVDVFTVVSGSSSFSFSPNLSGTVSGTLSGTAISGSGYVYSDVEGLLFGTLYGVTDDITYSVEEFVSTAISGSDFGTISGSIYEYFSGIAYSVTTYEIDTSGIGPDRKVYTGGGIHQSLPTPTATFGSREATIKPAVGTYPVPQIYIESELDNIMYHVPLASGNPNTNRYVFGIYVDGLITSDLYLEMWDDITFSTTDLPTLCGTPNYPHSVFNAVRTTDEIPPEFWTGASGNTVYLAGYNNRLRLKGVDTIQNETLYYNMYAAIPWDLEFTHDQPVEAYRYLYI